MTGVGEDSGGSAQKAQKLISTGLLASPAVTQSTPVPTRASAKPLAPIGRASRRRPSRSAPIRGLHTVSRAVSTGMDQTGYRLPGLALQPTATSQRRRRSLLRNLDVSRLSRCSTPRSLVSRGSRFHTRLGVLRWLLTGLPVQSDRPTHCAPSLRPGRGPTGVDPRRPHSLRQRSNSSGSHLIRSAPPRRGRVFRSPAPTPTL